MSLQSKSSTGTAKLDDDLTSKNGTLDRGVLRTSVCLSFSFLGLLIQCSIELTNEFVSTKSENSQDNEQRLVILVSQNTYSNHSRV